MQQRKMACQGVLAAAGLAVTTILPEPLVQVFRAKDMRVALLTIKLVVARVAVAVAQELREVRQVVLATGLAELVV
jgi:hypothetical protein